MGLFIKVVNGPVNNIVTAVLGIVFKLSSLGF